jgi:hypothetical protein
MLNLHGVERATITIDGNQKLMVWFMGLKRSYRVNHFAETPSIPPDNLSQYS